MAMRRLDRRTGLAVSGGAAAAAVIGIASLPAGAQEKFPSNTIEVISHAAPGGGTDTSIRMWLPAAKEILGQDLVVVYKQGGGARAAQEYFKSQPADGHTIMALTQTHLYTIARGNSPITINDMQGLARAMDDPSLIVVRPDSPYQTYEDFVKASQNEALTWGVAQVGGTEHIGIARWAEAAGAKYRVVPFGSGGEMITALRSGAVEATLANVSEAISAIQEGDLKPLAALAENRVAELPDLPTAAEKGHDVSVSTTRGYAVRADTPPERVKILEEALLQALKSDQFQQYLRNSGLDPEKSIAGSKVWDEQLKTEYAESKEVIDQLGLAQNQ